MGAAGACAFFVCLIAMPMAGCSNDTAPSDGLETDTPDFVADQTYTNIAGRIAIMPDPARPLNQFSIAHEYIPDFRDRTGEIYRYQDGTPGMKAMTMAFSLAPGMTLDGFEVGDEIRFGFEVDWDGDPRNRVHQIRHTEDGDDNGSELIDG